MNCILMRLKFLLFQEICIATNHKSANDLQDFRLHRIYSINRPGARFSKVPVTFRARNQIFKSELYKE